MPARVRVGEHFVIEIVQQTDDSPLVGVDLYPAVARRAGTHRRLDRDGVLPQTLSLRVLAQQFPSILSVKHHFLVSPQFSKVTGDRTLLGDFGMWISDCGLANQLAILLIAASIRIPQSEIRNYLVTCHLSPVPFE